MSNPCWALWRRRLIDNAQLAFAMQAKLAKGVAFMRHRSTRLHVTHGMTSERCLPACADTQTGLPAAIKADATD